MLILASQKLNQVYRVVLCVSGIDLLDSIGVFIFFSDLSTTNLLYFYLLRNFCAKYFFKTCRVICSLIFVVGYRCDELNLMLPIAIGTV